MLTTKNRRYAELDSLRGLAACTVVISHFSLIFRPYPAYKLFFDSPFRVIAAGHEAVVMFFLLSGFVLAIPFSKPEPPTYSEYIVKRICRIYLPYLVAVLFAFAFDRVLYSPVMTPSSFINKAWTERPTLTLLFEHVAMLGNFDFAQLNIAFWSLVYEARISIIYPLLLWIANRVRPIILMPAAFVITMTMGVMAERFDLTLLFANFLYASFFLAGIVLFKNLEAIIGWVRGRSVLTRVLLGAAAIFCVYIPGGFHLPVPVIRGSVTTQSYLRDWIELVGVACFLVAAIDSKLVHRILLRPIPQRLGKISFSLYLVHGTVLFTLIRTCYGKVNFMWLAPVYFLAAYLAAEAFHHAIEVPTMNLGRNLATRIAAARETQVGELVPH